MEKECKMKKVSIKDIAQKAGVSNAAVSLVLSGKAKNGRVSKEKAEQIKQIADELNYQPNGLARSLQSGRSHTIGLLVADVSNPFFGSLAFYIQEQIENFGYAVIIMNTNESDIQMGRMLNILSNRQVDGYIVVPTEHGEQYIRPLAEVGFPLVLIDRYYPGIRTYAVTLNNYQASYQASDLLIQKGCKRIGLLVYSSSQSHMVERKYGYVDALQRAGIYNPGLIREVSFHNLRKDMEKAIPSLLEEGVDGLYFVTINISLEGVRVLLNLGIKIPEDIKIVCFDKSDAFDFMPNPIPYVQQPIEDMGRKAADLLLEQMDSDKRTMETCQFPSVLIL